MNKAIYQANNLGEYIYWSGIDFDSTRNAAWLHAIDQKNFNDETAHLIFEEPTFFNLCPLIGFTKFNEDTGNLHQPDSQESKVITFPSSQLNITNKIVCRNVKYAIDSNKGDDPAFHYAGKDWWGGVSSVKSTNDLVNIFDGSARGCWKITSISSSLDCEMFFQVNIADSIWKIGVRLPYFYRLKSTMQEMSVSLVPFSHDVMRSLITDVSHEFDVSLSKNSKVILILRNNNERFFVAADDVGVLKIKV